MRTRLKPAASCSGPRAHTSWIVEQFGFATMPSCPVARVAVHFRHDERDTVGEPKSGGLVDAESASRDGSGTSSELAAVPTEKKHRSSSPAPSASGVASSTTSSRSP